MATVNILGAATFTTANGTKTVVTTPAYGDLIVIVTAHTGNTSAATPTDNNAGGNGTYTEIAACASVKATSADQMRVFIRNAIIFSATSTTFTHAPGTTSGGGLVVFSVVGLARTGSAGARQGAVQNNQAAATPTPVLGSAALTGNCLIGAVFNATTTAATMTARSSPAWSERCDVGYNTPTSGLETMTINSGETATSIAWGSASSSAYCASVLELDCSAEVPTSFVAAPVVPAKR